MLHRQKKYREPSRHDLHPRLRCVLLRIRRAEKTERQPQAMRSQGSSVEGIGGDSRRYDSSTETMGLLDFATVGRAAASEEAEWISPLRAIFRRLQ